TRGRHTIKLGGEALLRYNHTESHTFFPGRFVFGNLAAGAAPTGSGLLSPCLISPGPSATTNACGLSSGIGLNSLQAVSAGCCPPFYQQGFDNPVYRAKRPVAGFFAQDSWAMRPNLRLDYGLPHRVDGA